MVNILLFLKSYSRILETVQKYAWDRTVISSDPSHLPKHFFEVSALVRNLSFPFKAWGNPVSISLIPLTTVQQKQSQDFTSNKKAASNPISLSILLNFSRKEITVLILWSENSAHSGQNANTVKSCDKLLYCLWFTLKHCGTNCVTAYVPFNLGTVR